jgi:phosphatidate cytidylyltransferase
MAARPQRRPRGTSDLGARVAVAIPAALVGIAMIALGGAWFAAGIVVLGVACIGELFTLYARIEPNRLAGFLGVIALIVAAYAGEGFHVLLTFVAFFPVVFVLSVALGRTGASGMMVTIFGVAWVGLAMAHGMLLRELPHGAAIMIDILVGTFIGDTGAYFGGRTFGRRKLAPAISPNKTVEGLVIGMLTAIVATWLAGAYQDWLSGTDALLLGLGVAIAAPIGDLFESFVKREAGTKDTGRLFGAHGGALDRLDAVFFTVVTGYYIWLALL